MSGGAVLNSRGQLVAIHGRSETDTAPSEEADLAVKTGTSQGVPVAFWREPGGAAATTEPVRQPERESPREPEREIRQDPPATTASAGDAAAYVNSADQKFESGDHQGAIADYNQALAIDPRYALAYHGRGFAKEKLGDQPGACQDYAMAIRLGSKITQPCQ